MSLITRYPTPYADVNDIIAQLLAGVECALPQQFVGLYLYGSLAAGDFDPETSDIDFVVVTEDELPPARIKALEELHAHLETSGGKWAGKLDGAYLPQQVMRRYDEDDRSARPTLNERRFYLAAQGYDWVIQRHILREAGIIVKGPHTKSLIDEVGPDELRHAIARLLYAWWAPMIEEPARLTGSDYQAYAILTMCRAIYGMRYGRIVSKPVAGRWAQVELSEQWGTPIAAALTWRPGVVLDSRSDTQELIRCALGIARLWG